MQFLCWRAWRKNRKEKNKNITLVSHSMIRIGSIHLYERLDVTRRNINKHSVSTSNWTCNLRGFGLHIVWCSNVRSRSKSGAIAVRKSTQSPSVIRLQFIEFDRRRPFGVLYLFSCILRKSFSHFTETILVALRCQLKQLPTFCIYIFVDLSTMENTIELFGMDVDTKWKWF